MKALLQRVINASVEVKNHTIAEIGKGILVFVGVEKDDTEDDVMYLSKKIPALRIFEDNQNKMNLSVKDINGEILVISQFTLAGDTRKGNRPSFDRAERPERAEKLYMFFIEEIKKHDIPVKSGIFGEYMRVYLINDGPVTFLIDSKA